MDCPRCGSLLPEDAQNCHCDAAVPQFDAPDGFTYDPDSGLYYRIDYGPDGQPAGATWFDCINGTYQQVVYDNESEEQPELNTYTEVPPDVHTQQAPDDEPQLCPSDESPAADLAPEGFAYDESSGLYYRETMDVDSQTNEPIRVITWFYPETGRYERSVYPVEDAFGQSGLTASAALEHHNRRPRSKKKVIIVSAAVVLAAGLGVLSWAMGWLTFGGTDTDAQMSNITDVPLEDAHTVVDTDETPEPPQVSRSDQQPSNGEAVANAALATPSAVKDTAEVEEINSLEELREILCRIKTQIAAGTTTLNEQEALELEEKINLFIKENPQLETEIEEILAGKDAGEYSAQSLRMWSECPVNVSASSTLPPSKQYNYNASNVLDGNKDTAWVEGAEGTGIDEWIILNTTSGESALLNELLIMNGYQRTGSTYTSNARIRELIIEFSDGSSISHTLLDDKEWQRIPLKEAVTTSYVKIIIKSVYNGLTYEDACIGGIAFS